MKVSRNAPEKNLKSVLGPQNVRIFTRTFDSSPFVAQCTKHYPTPYTYPLPVVSDWNQGRAQKSVRAPKTKQGSSGILQFLGPQIYTFTTEADCSIPMKRWLEMCSHPGLTIDLASQWLLLLSLTNRDGSSLWHRPFGGRLLLEYFIVHCICYC